MLTFALRRIAITAPSLIGILALSFLLIHLIPGDPVDYVLGEQADPRDKENLRHELGLDLPLSHQFWLYLSGLLRLDWGKSLHSHNGVLSELVRHFPATVELALAALGLAVLWSLPLGVCAAAKRNSWLDRAAASVSVVGVSIPGVFLGPALVYLFAMRLDWFPISERGNWEHLVLPAASLALPLGSVITGMTRAAMFEVIDEDYIRTARAKGAAPTRIYFKHALRNALIPIVTIVGLQLGALMTGTVITETIFDWPGLGTLLFGSIQRRDYPVVQGCVLLVGCIYLTVNLLTDLSYGLVNPRARAKTA